MCFGRPAATLHWALFGYLFKPSLEMQPRARFRGMVWMDRTAARQVLIQIKVDVLFQLSQVGGAPGDPRDRGHTVAPALACYSVTGSQRRVVVSPLLLQLPSEKKYAFRCAHLLLQRDPVTPSHPVWTDTCCQSMTRSHRRPRDSAPAASA